MWYTIIKEIITNQAMNNDKFRQFCEFQIKSSHFIATFKMRKRKQRKTIQSPIVSRA